MPQRGVITLHLGQCGVQTSNSIWELLCLEHDVKNDGKIRKKNRVNFDLDTNDTFFEECPNGKYVPRSVIFDTEPTVVDQIRTGRKRNLFRPDCLISGKEDSGNVFARGFYTLSNDMGDLLLDRIRKVAETCHGMQGFMIFRSYGGGTGSGLGSSIMNSLREDYGKLTQVEVATVPSGHFSTAVVEPYNAVFSTHESMINSDCALFFDNEAMYNMLQHKLKMHSVTYKDINRMVAQVISAVTSSLRFSSMVKVDLTDLQTNLVPYPRIHFPMAAIAPVIPRHTDMANMDKELTCTKITKNLFNKHSFMMMIDPTHGKYMSCCIMYRGLIAPKEINQTISGLKKCRSIQFVDWCPTGFKIGINHGRMCIPKPMQMERLDTSAIMLSNSTAIIEFWSQLNKKFDLMNNKRGFWHHYIQEGMPEQDFADFREDLAALELDYLEVAEDTIMDFGYDAGIDLTNIPIQDQLMGYPQQGQGDSGAADYVPEEKEEFVLSSQEEVRQPSRRGTAEELRQTSRRGTAEEERQTSRRGTAEEQRQTSRRGTAEEERQTSRRGTAEEERQPSQRGSAEERQPSQRGSEEPATDMPANDTPVSPDDITEL